MRPPQSELARLLILLVLLTVQNSQAFTSLPMPPPHLTASPTTRLHVSVIPSQLASPLNGTMGGGAGENLDVGPLLDSRGPRRRAKTDAIGRDWVERLF